MGLTAGARLGAYEIVGLIGAGGMGEVYRARDTRLDRQVAIKSLPDAFRSDPDRAARFEREAKLLATLNHPNIAGIYGLEQADGQSVILMELVEGETLADRIARGQIPLDEALPIAKQIAEALEAAHEQGVIHRDLKPANIKLRPDGSVKVLDFGLAKVLNPVAADGTPATLTNSPTITSPATMSAVGMILGTAAYMSPEQAKGKPADKRSDVWAFGCVLYEMLTGRRPFGGDDVTDTLAFIITKTPEWRALPANTPASVDRLLRRCLEKDLKRRLNSGAAVRLEIDDALAAALASATDAEPTSTAVHVRWRPALLWSIAGALMLVLTTVLGLWSPWRTSVPSAPRLPVVRLEAALGADASPDTLTASLAASPDGSFLVVAARSSQGTQQLYLRRLGELRAGPLAGTVNARNPFFSPDSQWIGFFADGSLKKIAVTGGAAVTLCAAGDDRGGTWAEDGSIVFQTAGNGGLSRVSSAGGTPVALTTLGAGEVTHRWPQVLPGGKAVLYTAHSNVSGFDDATIVVQPLPNGTPQTVQRSAYYGRYLQSGHLVYIHQGTLFAKAFDLARLEPTGQPAPVVEGISTYTGLAGVGGQSGAAQVAWTETGTAVYLAGQNESDDAPIEWMDRAGKVTALRATPSAWSNPQFSPNGRQLAVDIVTRQTDVFTYDWARDTLTQVTFGTGLNLKPVWTPDGRRLVFRFRAAHDTGVLNLYWQRADGSGDVQRLSDSQNSQVHGSWHPSGRFLVFYEPGPQTANDLMILPMEGDETSGWKPGKPTVFFSTPLSEFEPMFSPDGRWIAYVSNESGRNEVFVRPFPSGDGKWKVSTDGGTYPTWSRARQELFYGSPDNRILVTSYTTTGDSFKADKPRVWSERRFRPRAGRSFDLHPDGDRFALAAAPENESAAKEEKLVFIFNLFDELKRLVPTN